MIRSSWLSEQLFMTIGGVVNGVHCTHWSTAWQFSTSFSAFICQWYRVCCKNEYCIYVCVFIHVCLTLPVCVYVWFLYACMHMCVCVHVCIHAHVFREFWWVEKIGSNVDPVSWSWTWTPGWDLCIHWLCWCIDFSQHSGPQPGSLPVTPPESNSAHHWLWCCIGFSQHSGPQPGSLPVTPPEPHPAHHALQRSHPAAASQCRNSHSGWTSVLCFGQHHGNRGQPSGQQAR